MTDPNASLPERIQQMRVEDERIRQECAGLRLSDDPLPYGHHREAYAQSVRISAGVEHDSFYALLMATMRAADTFNAIRLREAFPELWLELMDRYNAPAGLLPSEQMSYPDPATPED